MSTKGMRLQIAASEPTSRVAVAERPERHGPTTWCLECQLGDHSTCEANAMPFCQCRRDGHAATPTATPDPAPAEPGTLFRLESHA